MKKNQSIKNKSSFCSLIICTLFPSTLFVISLYIILIVSNYLYLRLFTIQTNHNNNNKLRNTMIHYPQYFLYATTILAALAFNALMVLIMATGNLSTFFPTTVNKPMVKLFNTHYIYHHFHTFFLLYLWAKV